jgi:hypothetical protein
LKGCQARAPSHPFSFLRCAQIHHLTSFKDNVFRAALFSENIHAIVFPPLVHFPGEHLPESAHIRTERHTEKKRTSKMKGHTSIPAVPALASSSPPFIIVTPTDSEIQGNIFDILMWPPGSFANPQTEIPDPETSPPPGVSELAAKDLRGYVSAGNNAVFIGSYNWLSVMNDVFGFQLMSDYKDGPYYRNDRNVRGTPFQWSMDRLAQPDGSVYGVKVDSIPMDGKCMFDTMGACVVFYIKYNLGTVTYVAFDYDTPYGIDHWDQILHAAMMM